MTIKLRLAVATLIVALAGVGHQAEANIVFTIQDASMKDGDGNDAGMLTGTFTTDDALTTLIDYNITATAASEPVFSFPGFVYTPATSSLTAPFLPTYFRLDSSGGDELRLYFSSALTAAGASLSTANSYEHEAAGGNRYLTGGSVTAFNGSVPEPSSIAMLGTASVFGLGVLARRRRKAA